ncbi:hypothetical protein EJ04DRAFT_510375 [Polyplosphaeria fusca]|uniref:Uncharacterized protein n=1 Tax=Polyplosphaeria fusca TaxID=682080 RepID=A0A9P4V5B3_9PLEO|nr:hypothetical protein EJ04DRAFT_510375 [Polyplosphaeria fusca]
MEASSSQSFATAQSDQTLASSSAFQPTHPDILHSSSVSAALYHPQAPNRLIKIQSSSDGGVTLETHDAQAAMRRLLDRDLERQRYHDEPTNEQLENYDDDSDSDSSITIAQASLGGGPRRYDWQDEVKGFLNRLRNIDLDDYAELIEWMLIFAIFVIVATAVGAMIWVAVQ